MPPHVAIPGFHLFTLGQADDGDGRRLELAWEPFHPDPEVTPDDAAKGDAVLLDGVDSVEMSYFGAPRDGGDADWYDNADFAGVPELVRIRVAFPPGDRRYWPELVVAPRLAGPIITR